MLKFTERPKTPGTTWKKNMAFHEGNKLFVGDLRASLDEKKRWYGSIYKEMELDCMDCIISRILSQKVCSYKCQFCTKVCTSSKLVSHTYMIAGQSIKKRYLMCQIPIKMLKQHAIPNSSLHNLKIYSSKGCRKTSQRRIICNLCS